MNSKNPSVDEENPTGAAGEDKAKEETPPEKKKSSPFACFKKKDKKEDEPEKEGEKDEKKEPEKKEEKKDEPKKKEESKEGAPAEEATEEPGEKKSCKEALVAFLQPIIKSDEEILLDENGEPIAVEKITAGDKEPVFSKKHWWIWVIPLLILVVTIIIVSIAASPKQKESFDLGEVEHPPENNFGDPKVILECDDNHVLVE